jgi:hypothetical protein
MGLIQYFLQLHQQVVALVVASVLRLLNTQAQTVVLAAVVVTQDLV